MPPEQQSKRRRITWRNKKGRGFDLIEQENGKWDFSVMNRNKAIITLSFEKETIEALRDKLNGV